MHGGCRWDGCFIRLLDGMLQAGALGSADYNLRIPTKIRHLAILDSSPAIPAGSQGTFACPFALCQQPQTLFFHDNEVSSAWDCSFFTLRHEYDEGASHHVSAC